MRQELMQLFFFSINTQNTLSDFGNPPQTGYDTGFTVCATQNCPNLKWDKN